MARKKFNEKDARKFLKERKLNLAFNRFVKIKPKPKRIIEVAVTLEGGARQRRRLLLVKENNKTVIRDFNTLDVLRRTNASFPKAILGLHPKKGKPTKKTISFIKSVRQEVGADKDKKIDRDWDVTEKVGDTNPLPFERVEQSYNESSKLLRKVITTTKPKPRMFGSVIVDATVIHGVGKNQLRVRVQARSKGGIELSNQIARDKAKEDAIDNLASVAQFSPDQIIIHNYFYEYRIDERVTLTRTR